MAAIVRKRGGKDGGKSQEARMAARVREREEVRMAARVRERGGKNGGKSQGARRYE